MIITSVLSRGTMGHSKNGTLRCLKTIFYSLLKIKKLRLKSLMIQVMVAQFSKTLPVEKKRLKNPR
jgi:hypothetical protein